MLTTSLISYVKRLSPIITAAGSMKVWLGYVLNHKASDINQIRNYISKTSGAENVLFNNVYKCEFARNYNSIIPRLSSNYRCEQEKIHLWPSSLLSLVSIK